MRKNIRSYAKCNGCDYLSEYEDCNVCIKDIEATTDEANCNIISKPSHYNQGSIEPIDVIIDWKLDYCLGNALKYIVRCNHKGNKKQDLEKAIQYLKFELEKVK